MTSTSNTRPRDILAANLRRLMRQHPELNTLPNVKVILALGKIAHDSVLTTLGARISAHPFQHGSIYEIGKFKLISSYHCSRYNTNTRRLTTEMFEDVVGKAKELAQT